MELRHMRYFVALAEGRNFTRAAARLHLAQPSLGRQIRDLENEVGVPLLHRGKGGITLTAAGNEYLARARKLLADSDAPVRVAQAAGRSERRQLLIGTVVVQEAQRLRTLLEFVAQGLGVAIIPDPLYHCSRCVVFKKLEDLDLAANLQFVWLRHNDSALLKEFTGTTRQMARTLQTSRTEQPA
jgi:DNA-binding transcriptional LysR family regulator